MKISCKNIILTFVICCFSLVLVAQNHEIKSWCNLSCEYTEADRSNFELIQLRMQDDSIRQAMDLMGFTRFPLRFAFVQNDTSVISKSELEIRTAVENLNFAFKKAKLVFYLDRIDIINVNTYIEDLSNNVDFAYDKFSKKYDQENTITVFVLNHKSEFCKVQENGGFSCAKTGGFSYILSERSNNVVMSESDLLDAKIFPHEFGHFFGLFHTFENQLFGRESFDSNHCHETGDRICDTPPDPGTLFEVYVNYSTCEMNGLKGQEGIEYKPIITNYMSYYKPCYLKSYSFSNEQAYLMQLASSLPLRKKLSR
jgi:hypothetical protein